MRNVKSVDHRPMDSAHRGYEAGAHVSAMMFIAMILGLRASEILALLWDDIDLDMNVLQVCGSYVGASEDDTEIEESRLSTMTCGSS